MSETNPTEATPMRSRKQHCPPIVGAETTRGQMYNDLLKLARMVRDNTLLPVPSVNIDFVDRTMTFDRMKLSELEMAGACNVKHVASSCTTQHSINPNNPDKKLTGEEFSRYGWGNIGDIHVGYRFSSEVEVPETTAAKA